MRTCFSLLAISTLKLNSWSSNGVNTQTSNHPIRLQIISVWLWFGFLLPIVVIVSNMLVHSAGFVNNIRHCFGYNGSISQCLVSRPYFECRYVRSTCANRTTGWQNTGNLLGAKSHKKTWLLTGALSLLATFTK